MEITKTNRSFPGLVLPADYESLLDPLQTALAMQQLKQFIELNLETDLRLHRVSAPLFVEEGTGVNDDLNGVERPVAFGVRAMGGVRAEVVQSLAKWKRMALAEYGIPAGEGLFTSMYAIRPDEQPDNLHSLFVDQWDWEMHIRPEDRQLSFLRETVRRIYGILRRAERYMHQRYPQLIPVLPPEIRFVHAQALVDAYPGLSPREREQKVVQEYGAVFLIGIGGRLSDGRPHDGRAPDYDDWTTDNGEGYRGLNGDILLWHPLLNRVFELSSMGIRVDKAALLHQLGISGQEARLDLLFHQRLMNDELPLSIGGGIGQSRTGMFLLRKAHIGEISAGLWPEEMVHLCRAHNIRLL